MMHRIRAPHKLCIATSYCVCLSGGPIVACSAVARFVLVAAISCWAASQLGFAAAIRCRLVADLAMAGSSADKIQIPHEVRMLSGMLINRPLNVHNDMESQATQGNVSRACEISKALLQGPTKVERIEILLSSAGEIMLKPKATAEQEMEQPLFDPAVVRKLGDLPAAWVWGWLRQICVQHPPTCELISAMSINGTNVKHLRQAATGLPDAFELDDGMMEKNTMAAHLSHCHQKRGAPFAQLNLEDFVVGKVVHFTGGLGCLRLEKDEGSERSKYVIHQCTAGGRGKVNIIQLSSIWA